VVRADTDAWARVAAAVRARRATLDLTHTDVASGGGISVNVWSQIENNKQQSYRRRTLITIARTLRWPDDAIERVLAGDDSIDADTSRNESAPSARRDLTGHTGDGDGETVTLPAGLARRLRDATPHELVRLESYLDGLFEGRRDDR